jgi:hypothetical protein
MPSLVQFIEQNPYLVWLAAGVLFVLLNLITGFGRLMWPGVAAAAVAAFGLAGGRMHVSWELGIFAALTLFFWLLPRKLHNAQSAYVPAFDEAPPAPRRRRAPQAVGAMDRTGRLIGRIGKTTSEFSNGVGRVWIEGAEWGADLENGESLGSDTPVRVMRVHGGVRLQVRALTA